MTAAEREVPTHVLRVFDGHPARTTIEQNVSEVLLIEGVQNPGGVPTTPVDEHVGVCGHGAGVRMARN